MESLISSFHLDLGLFIAQLFNFAIVFALLYWFLFKPLLATMKERAAKIAKGLDNEEQTAAILAEASRQQSEIMKAAEAEALKILSEAKDQARLRQEAMIQKTKADLVAMIAQEKQKIQQAKAAILVELKGELSGLLIQAIAQILPGKLTDTDQKELIKKMLK